MTTINEMLRITLPSISFQNIPIRTVDRLIDPLPKATWRTYLMPKPKRQPKPRRLTKTQQLEEQIKQEQTNTAYFRLEYKRATDEKARIKKDSDDRVDRYKSYLENEHRITERLHNEVQFLRNLLQGVLNVPSSKVEP